MEFVFDFHWYSKEKKGEPTVVEFIDYAIIGWDQLVINKRCKGEIPINTWKEMKKIMRKRFVPNHYCREIYNTLQSLSQGSKNIDEYFEEMRIVMIRANVFEDRKATLTKF